MSEEEKIATNYPDIVEQGGTLSAVRMAFHRKHDGLEIEGFGTGLGYAHLRCGERSAQVFLALEERLFLMDFSVRGRKLARGQTPAFGELVASLDRWLLRDCTPEGLLIEFPFVTLKAPKRV